VKHFSSEQLKELNATHTRGRFVEAAVFTRDMDNPSIKDYFVRNRRPLVFQGETYLPLDITWIGMKTTASMELPNNQVVISNLGGVVIDFIEDNDIDINGNDVLLKVLYIDKFGKISLTDEMLYQVELIVADYYKSATFNLGVNYSLGDVIPRQTLETQEYPGLRQDVIRIGT